MKILFITFLLLFSYEASPELIQDLKVQKIVDLKKNQVNGLVKL